MHIKNLGIGSALSSSSFSIQGLAHPPESGFSSWIGITSSSFLLPEGLAELWNHSPISSSSQPRIIPAFISCPPGTIWDFRDNPPIIQSPSLHFPLSKRRNNILGRAGRELRVGEWSWRSGIAASSSSPFQAPGEDSGHGKIPLPCQSRSGAGSYFSSGHGLSRVWLQRKFLFPSNPRKCSLTFPISAG